MKWRSAFLFCTAIIVLLFAVKITVQISRKQVPGRSRKRRNQDDDTPPLLLPSLSARSRMLPDQVSKELAICLLDSGSSSNTCPNSCTCVHHPTDVQIYDDQLNKLVTLEKNLPGEGYCVPAKRTKTCNPFTSDPVLVRLEQSYRYLCLCKYPHLVTKTSLLGDCDTRVECAGGGQLTPLEDPISFDPFLNGRCQCSGDGFLSYRDPLIGPACRPAAYADRVHTSFCAGGFVTRRGTCRCPRGYLKVRKNNPGYVHSSFRKQLTSNPICVKNPCFWSTSFPKEFLPLSVLDENEGRCVCDRLHGAFPISSSQSILSSASSNACQTFGSRTDPHSATNTEKGHRDSDYTSVKYACAFYRLEDGRQSGSDGEARRTCWFVYELPKPTPILNTIGTYVKVVDDQKPKNWLDSLLSHSNLIGRIRIREATPRQKRSMHFHMSTYAANHLIPQKIEEDVLSCLAHHENSGSGWRSLVEKFPLCSLNDRVYLSPRYLEHNKSHGIHNGFFVENTLEILNDLADQVSTQSSPLAIHSRILPEISMHRFESTDQTVYFPKAFFSTEL